MVHRSWPRNAVHDRFFGKDYRERKRAYQIRPVCGFNVSDLLPLPALGKHSLAPNLPASDANDLAVFDFDWVDVFGRIMGDSRNLAHLSNLPSPEGDKASGGSDEHEAGEELGAQVAVRLSDNL